MQACSRETRHGSPGQRVAVQRSIRNLGTRVTVNARRSVTVRCDRVPESPPPGGAESPRASGRSREPESGRPRQCAAWPGPSGAVCRVFRGRHVCHRRVCLPCTWRVEEEGPSRGDGAAGLSRAWAGAAGRPGDAWRLRCAPCTPTRR